MFLFPFLLISAGQDARSSKKEPLIFATGIILLQVSLTVSGLKRQRAQEDTMVANLKMAQTNPTVPVTDVRSLGESSCSLDLDKIDIGAEFIAGANQAHTVSALSFDICSLDEEDSHDPLDTSNHQPAMDHLLPEDVMLDSCPRKPEHKSNSLESLPQSIGSNDGEPQGKEPNQSPLKAASLVVDSPKKTKMSTFSRRSSTDTRASSKCDSIRTSSTSGNFTIASPDLLLSPRTASVSFALPEDEVAMDVPLTSSPQSCFKSKNIPTMGSFLNASLQASSPDAPPKMVCRHDSLPSLDYNHQDGDEGDDDSSVQEEEQQATGEIDPLTTASTSKRGKGAHPRMTTV